MAAVALTATLDKLSYKPGDRMTLTVVSDKRLQANTINVAAAGETIDVTTTVRRPVSITGPTWALKSDDGHTAVYTAVAVIAAGPVAVTAAGETVTVQPVVVVPVTFSDFTQNAKTSGLVIPATATGVSYSMVPHTSTKGPTVAALVKGATNQYTLLSLGGNDPTGTVAGIALGPFDLVGTDQGHLYNGIRVGYSTGAHLHDINISGIPGNDSSPPGETFGISLWHADGAVADRLRVLGAGVGATLIGLNSTIGATLTNCLANGSVYGFGLACWQSKDIQVIDFDARNNRKALNFERCSGVIGLTRVDMRGQTSTGPHIAINSDQASAKVVITDPKLDVGAWPLRVGVIVNGIYGPKNLPQLQKVSDVQLIVDGKDVSADPKMLACGNVW